jgi:hypothetical protein
VRGRTLYPLPSCKNCPKSEAAKASDLADPCSLRSDWAGSMDCGHQKVSVVSPPALSERVGNDGPQTHNAASLMELLFRRQSCFHYQGESSMQAALDRIMQTYGMIVQMTPNQERIVREKVASFLGQKSEKDEQKLTIAGLQYVRALKL